MSREGTLPKAAAEKLNVVGLLPVMTSDIQSSGGNYA
jgi:hypothetical protein